MRRARLALVWLAPWIALVSFPAGADDALSEVAGPPMSIGVAPFEIVGPVGAEVPDVAVLLAERLGTRGVTRVVGPGAMEVPASAEPAPTEVQAWASRADVGAVVVGRTTRLGRKLALDVRLRSGASGRVMQTYVEEVPRPAELATVVDRLADAVIQGTLAGQTGPGGSPVFAARGKRPGNATSGSPRSSSSREPFQGNAPISIQADELEAVEAAGGRKLNFRGNVRATQDDLTLRSERLEAFYPPGQSQPDKLVATGRVVILRTGRRADCRKAVYYRDGQRVVCTGEPATLTQSNDRVRGKEIIFYLDRDVLEVKGGADVVIHPNEGPEGSSDGESS